MKLLHNIAIQAILLALATPAWAQDKTVFITTEEDYKPKEKARFVDEIGTFTQIVGSAPYIINPNYGNDHTFYDADGDGEDDGDNQFIPDGISFHAGAGFDADEIFGVGLFTGIDWNETGKLWSVPIYASAVLKPQLSDDFGLLFQAGLGWTLAIGRGDLSGLYQKYRIGYLDSDGYGIFAEVNGYGFKWRSDTQFATFNLGVSLYMPE